MPTIDRIHKRASKLTQERRQLSRDKRPKDYCLANMATNRLCRVQIEFPQILNDYENVDDRSICFTLKEGRNVIELEGTN